CTPQGSSSARSPRICRAAATRRIRPTVVAMTRSTSSRRPNRMVCQRSTGPRLSVTSATTPRNASASATPPISPSALSGGLAVLAGAVHREQQLMKPGLAGELRVKRDGQDIALPDGDRVAVDRGEDFDVLPVLGHPRRPDEHGADRVSAHTIDVEVGLK